jgi:hypothetical protein
LRVSGSGRGREKHAERGSRSAERQTLPNDQTEHTAVCRADCNADTDFAAALTDGVREDSVNAECREKNSDDGRSYVADLRFEFLFEESLPAGRYHSEMWMLYIGCTGSTSRHAITDGSNEGGRIRLRRDDEIH